MYLKLVFTAVVLLLASYANAESTSTLTDDTKKCSVYYDISYASDNLLRNKKTMINTIGFDYLVNPDTETTVGIAIHRSTTDIAKIQMSNTGQVLILRLRNTL